MSGMLTADMRVGSAIFFGCHDTDSFGFLVLGKKNKKIKENQSHIRTQHNGQGWTLLALYKAAKNVGRRSFDSRIFDGDISIEVNFRNSFNQFVTNAIHFPSTNDQVG